jgi:microcin C transport system substrate-binding protein
LKQSKFSPQLLPVCGLVLALLILLFAQPQRASAAQKVHGLSAFGELKYTPDFKHFSYVNPNAPKGGKLSMIGTAGLSTFNSFNAFILKGDGAQGLGYLFDQLMVRAFDEPDAVYGLVAKSAELADDKKSITFYLRENARFSDETPITAKDIKASFELIKSKGHPAYTLLLRDITKVEIIDKLTVRYHFKGEQIRDLPRIVATLPVLSAKYYETHDFTKTTLDAPLGSGPYKIKSHDQGRQVTYERRKNYWAKGLPVNTGRFNFDELRYEYFRDQTAEFQSLIAGNFDLREEFISRDWATKYNKPQFKNGRMIRETLPDKSPSGAQGFFLNLRREKFADIRVRKAIGLAFDFEWTNKNLFYGAYKRTQSFFENSDMKAHGMPSKEEIALLEPYRSELPKEVFGPPFSPPKTNASGKDRKSLRQALRLLRKAGWTVSRDKKRGRAVLRNKKGEEFTIEFLTFSSAFERIIAPYIRNLAILGIKANIRQVDSSQYERRLKDFHFDITTRRYVLGLTPGVAMRNYWSSRSANTVGSLNLSGIKSKAVDGLIEKMIDAKSRSELVIAANALDRVLRAGHYWVPQWFSGSHRMAYWNKFGKPDTKPPYDRAIIDTWWVDEAKTAKLKQK